MDTTIERVIFLQRIELFADVPSEQLTHLAGITTKVSKSKGEMLFQKGDQSQSLYLLFDGRMTLTRNGSLKKEVSDPEAIGVWGFFDGGERLLSATCISECHFLIINSMEFYDLLEERVHLSRGLLKYFIKRIRKLTEVSDAIV